MKACADQGKRLPTDSELTKLANDLYNTTVSGGDGEVTYAPLDMNKMSQYGLPVDNITIYGVFLMWSSGQETDARDAHAYTFYSDATGWFSDAGRDGTASYLWAVCVGE